MANKELSKYKSIDVTNIATRNSYDLTFSTNQLK